MNDPFDGTGLADLTSRRTLKWTRYPPGVLPAWVADMDLPTAPFVTEVLAEAAARGELGYPRDSLRAELIAAFVDRAARLWDWTVDPAGAVVVTDVMTGVCQLVEALSDPGDEILVPTPVYPPFLRRPADLGRTVVEVPCVAPDDGSTFDVAALDAAVTPRTSLVAVVNPQNPTGRVLTRPELVAVAEVAERHDLLVIVDEVHAELLHDGNRHVPMATVSDAAARRTVTVNAATKAFNVAGFRCAVVVLPTADLVSRFDRRPAAVRGEISTLSAEVTIAAWTRGDQWLAGVRGALTARRDHLARRLATERPDIGFSPPQATFLAWLDLTGLGLGKDAAGRIERAGRLAVSSGRDFGRAGAGHVRLNFAAPWPVLDDAIDRLIQGVGG